MRHVLLPLVLRRCLRSGACAVALAASACGGDGSPPGSSPTACSPAAEVACTCAGGIQGEKTCLPEGNAYGPCWCGGGGGAGAGGGGSGGACQPGAVTACYSGPADTEGVGTCKAGTATCAEDGSELGPCVGEVTPHPDVCASAADEDCNASPMPCVDGWAKVIPAKWAGQLVADADGNTIFTARSEVATDYGGGAEPPGTCIVKLDPGGSFVWATCFAEFTEATALAVDPAGSVLVSGIYGSADLGGGPLPDWGGAQQNMFLLKLDAAGKHVWSRGFGAMGQHTTGGAVAADALGNVIVSGNASTISGGTVAIDYGTGPVELGLCGVGTWGSVTGKFDASGNPEWAYGLTGAYPAVLTADSAGRVVLAGDFDTLCPVDFGSGAKVAVGQDDGYVLVLDAQGNHVFDREIGSAGGIGVNGLKTDATDRIVLGGYFHGTNDFGEGPVSAGGDYAAFLTMLDADGTSVWTNTAGSAGSTDVLGLALDPETGELLTSGRLAGAADFGGGVLTSVDTDLYLARYDASGVHVASETFPADSDQLLFDLAASPTGAPIVHIHTHTPIDLGTGPVGPGLVVAQIPE